MSIIYKCRHCGQHVGELDQSMVETSSLGWDQLSKEEQQEMIHYKENGDVHIQTICESCEATLGAYPEYHELDFFIQ